MHASGWNKNRDDKLAKKGIGKKFFIYIYIYVYIDHILVTQEENVAREKGSNVVYMTSPPL